MKFNIIIFLLFLTIQSYSINYQSIFIEYEKENGTEIKLNIAFLQDFSRTEETHLLETPIEFGLKNNYNLPLVTLTIDY